MNKGIIFEKQVLALLKKMGFDAEMTKASGDGGIDIIAHKHDDIVGGKFIIQCKNWSKPIGEPPIRDLYGVVASENANKGLLITQSVFTAQAVEFAQGKPLELIDGQKLQELFKKYELSLFPEEPTTDISDDDLRITELKKQVDKSPKNIFLLKELGDLYLKKTLFEEAVNCYEKLVNLKPEIYTQKLDLTYNSGFNNLGVANALLKQYDKAIEIFKEMTNRLEVPSDNEAYLYHYLGLFDLAKNSYEKIRLWRMERNVNYSWVDTLLELAYMETFLEKPVLKLFYLDENSDVIFFDISLDSPIKKALEECNATIYWEIGEDCIKIIETLTDLGANLRFNTDYEKIYTTPAIDEIEQVKDECKRIISKCKTLLENNDKSYAAINKIIDSMSGIIEQISLNISTLIDYLSSKQDYSQDIWDSLLANPLPLNYDLADDLAEQIALLTKESKIIYGKARQKWEEILEIERIDWQKKLIK